MYSASTWHRKWKWDKAEELSNHRQRVVVLSNSKLGQSRETILSEWVSQNVISLHSKSQEFTASAIAAAAPIVIFHNKLSNPCWIEGLAGNENKSEVNKAEKTRESVIRTWYSIRQAFITEVLQFPKQIVQKKSVVRMTGDVRGRVDNGGGWSGKECIAIIFAFIFSFLQESCNKTLEKEESKVFSCCLPPTIFVYMSKNFY